jgi:hypothetical protein
MIFTNAATTFSDHSLKTILESLRRQDIIVDAIGPTWGQQDEEEEENEENNQPNSPMNTNGDENSDVNRPTTNGNHHQTPRKPLTQQQQTGIRVIGQIVNSTEGTLFTFRYHIKLFIHKYLFIMDCSFLFFPSEALTILSVHQAKIVKPTATKYIMQLADLKLHICTYIQV